MPHPSLDQPWVTHASCSHSHSTVPLSKYRLSCTYASHHLSNHSIPVPTLILSTVRTILHQLHLVFETQFFTDFRQQIHAESFQLWAFWNRIRLLLYKYLEKYSIFKISVWTDAWNYRPYGTFIVVILSSDGTGEEYSTRRCQYMCTLYFQHNINTY